MKRLSAAVGIVAMLAGTPVFGQAYQDSGGTYVRGVVPIQPGVGPLFTPSNPGKISGSFSASISGFQPSASGSVGTPISAQTSVITGSTQSLPSGTVVIASNVGATNIAYCQLGSTASTSSQPIAPGGGWFAFTVGSATQLTCVTSSGTTTVNTLGGSGLPTGTGGGGGGGGGSNASIGSTGSAAPSSATYNGMLVSGGNMAGVSGSPWGSAPSGLNVLGVNADVLSSALPTGAATAANQTNGSQKTQVVDGSDSNLFTSGNPGYVNCANCSGGGGGGGSGGLIQATNSVPIAISTATTTKAIAGTSGQYTYITAWDIIAAGTGNLSLEYGTTTSTPCDTSPQALTGTYNLTAQAGEAKGGGAGAVLFVPQGDDVCVVTSAAITYSGSIAYTQNATAVTSFGGGGGSNTSVGSIASTAPTSATYNGMLVSGGNMVGASGSTWGSAPSGLNVLGVNADVLSSALPTGAATAANQEVTAAGTSATSAQAVQGVAGGVPMPTNSANTGGSLTSIIQAGASVPINISTATTTQLVAAVTGKSIYVTSWDVMAGGTGNFMLEYGTGSNCGTGTTAMTGAYPLTAQFGIAKGSGLGPVLIVPAGNALCAMTSAAIQYSGSLTETQF